MPNSFIQTYMMPSEPFNPKELEDVFEDVSGDWVTYTKEFRLPLTKLDARCLHAFLTSSNPVVSILAIIDYLQINRNQLIIWLDSLLDKKDTSFTVVRHVHKRKLLPTQVFIKN